MIPVTNYFSVSGLISNVYMDTLDMPTEFWTIFYNLTLGSAQINHVVEIGDSLPKPLEFGAFFSLSSSSFSSFQTPPI